jgi:4-hydroxy-3-methylbut-2-enyl diphosphate reductase
MKGLLSQAEGNAIAFEEPDQLDFARMPGEITLYSQTTKSLARFYEVAEIIGKHGIKVNLQDTVCRQVHNREAKLDDFCRENDKNIFIAGRDSSNGKVLFRICKAANEKTYFISDVSEIQREWFEAGDSVGISGATSTPLWQMQRVKEMLEKW